MQGLNKGDKERLAKEWSSIACDIKKIWLTPDTLAHASRFFRDLLKKHPENYYDIDEFGMDTHLVNRLRPIFQFFFYQYWRVDVAGIKNIPDKDGAMLVSNHSGGIPFDGTMINMAVYNEHPRSRDLRFLVEDFVYHFPFLGTFISRTGGVRACPENAELLLKKKQLVAIFPEGIKGIGKLHEDKYKLQRFGRAGYVRIALRAKCKIIPTAVIGAEDTYPIIAKSKLLAKFFGLPYFPITPTFPHLGVIGMLPLPAKWTIAFGKPIDCSKHKKGAASDDLLVRKINRQVRNEIKKLIDAHNIC